MYFLQFWKMRGTRSRSQQNQCLMSAASKMAPWCYVFTWQKRPMGKRGQCSSFQPFYKVLVPFMRSETSLPNHRLLKAPPLNTVTLEIKLQHEFCREYKHSHHSSPSPRASHSIGMGWGLRIYKFLTNF